MHSHLVAVKVRVEGGGDERVQLDRRAFDQDRLECLDAQAVQRRRTVQQHRSFADDAFERFPDLGTVALDQAACAFDVGGVVVLHQSCNDERAV